jgi:predicted nucleic acid-binding protein
MWRMPESSILIPYLREGHYRSELRRAVHDGRLLLSSVVAEEILAGARDQRQRREYDAFFDLFGRRGLILTPTDTDWQTCGRLLSRFRRRFGAIEPRDHQNDILILLGALGVAREQEVALMTENDAHFRMWLAFLQDAPTIQIEAMRRA